MTKEELNIEYFEWMYRLVCGNEPVRGLSYRKLLTHLHTREFVYLLPMDGNRADDGTDLRYRFGYQHDYKADLIGAYLDDRPCSVLEMMAALSIRCEENIMDDPNSGDRTGQWFWNMVVNLGLGSMDDRRFRPGKVDYILDRFMNREYEPTGEGGLFTIRNSHRDLRTVEIWYQMCWFLDENFEEER